MPRPGSRPYECVRRAWHCDRLQPIRGSLIQELFRVANDIHSIQTRKNREWQQKLPLVVLKAEEIMYSKANSEEEYLDPKTLLERANDAIDTIIRKEEDDETGDLLQPCIEAALTLGCVPRKASRSERHNSPRCYLNSYLQSRASLEDPILPCGLPPRGCGLQFASSFTPLSPLNCSRPGGESSSVPSFNLEGRGLNVKESDVDASVSLSPDSARALSSLGRVYPLQCSWSIRNSKLPFDSVGSLGCSNAALCNGASETREVGTCCQYDFFGPGNTDSWSHGSSNSGNACIGDRVPEMDLSLRIGPSSESILQCERTWLCEADDVASNVSSCGSRM